jgi:actin-related protein
VVHASSGARLAGFGGHAMTKMVAKKSGLGYDEAEAKKVGYSNPLNGVAHGGGPGIGQAEANQQQQQQQQQLSLEDMMGEEIASHISDISSACINASMVSLVAGEREWRKTLMEQIFVCGGGSRVPGFGSRVFEDLLEKHSSGFKPGLLSVPEYMPAEHALGCASWYGGHAIAGVVTNPAVVQKQCITRENYQEYGPKAIWKKMS